MAERFDEEEIKLLNQVERRTRAESIYCLVKSAVIRFEWQWRINDVIFHVRRTIIPTKMEEIFIELREQWMFTCDYW